MNDTSENETNPYTIMATARSKDGRHSFEEPDASQQPTTRKSSPETRGLMILLVIGGSLTMLILLMTLPQWAIPFVLGGFAGLFIAVKLAIEVMQVLRRR
ncbi:hypothetical protein [Bremerella sp.]|uniref:hypothetical protein n=1 Tax=Bremerella sp. TaxID=2795602 RepID=UPI00391C77A8